MVSPILDNLVYKSSPTGMSHLSLSKNDKTGIPYESSMPIEVQKAEPEPELNQYPHHKWKPKSVQEIVHVLKPETKCHILFGKLTVLTENRTVYGSVIPTSRPLVFLKQRLLFLTESGAGSLDLRSMKIRETECEGLNHSLARSYVFDATERSKAYGFTSEGEIIHVLLHGDIMNFKCRVRSKKKFQMEEPVALQSIKGYLLVINEDKVFAFNVSTQHYVRTAGPRLLFSAGLEEIRSSFLSHRQSSSRNVGVKARPLIASDRENLLVMGLGDGYFGVYKSKLPSLKGEFNTMLWSSPVFFFILFLFGAWHFCKEERVSHGLGTR
ncbi:hypothetical protein Bca52824_097045 [Brassica carinata]|uniref:CNH domain-containing protein n=1 Tax=Brassica carinata TaxID=52824 RepID=A0A8X7THW9_BRACI|nr:hypothetical protein Bca52824_097045 [Brassica carinata]